MEAPKSQVESRKHQDNANIHCQPLPESVSKEYEIYADYNGYHRRQVKQYGCPSVHFGAWRALMHDGARNLAGESRRAYLSDP